VSIIKKREFFSGIGLGSGGAVSVGFQPTRSRHAPPSVHVWEAIIRKRVYFFDIFHNHVRMHAQHVWRHVMLGPIFVGSILGWLIFLGAWFAHISLFSNSFFGLATGVLATFALSLFNAFGSSLLRGQEGYDVKAGAQNARATRE
jgi:hypothetical protein